MTNRALASTALVAALFGGLAASCSSSVSREQARDQATTATCQRYVMCNAIGAGKAYPTEPDCELQWQAMWDNYWPASTCDDKINQAALDVCLNAIGGTACNVVDFFATLGKCSAMNVCGASSNPDGG
jgi:hypothetical protein